MGSILSGCISLLTGSVGVVMAVVLLCVLALIGFAVLRIIIEYSWHNLIVLSLVGIVIGGILLLLL